MPHPYASSLELLKRTIDIAPSFFPEEKRAAMRASYEQMATDPKITQSKIDEAMGTFGKEIFPYRKAFWQIHNRFGREIETRSIHDLIKNPALKEKLALFLKNTGTIADVGRGTQAFDTYFTPEEKAELVEAKLAAHDKVVSEIQSLCTGPEKDTCVSSISQYKLEQERVSKMIGELQRLAERGEKWRAEIMDKVRTFEAGWSGLEREVREEDVRGEIEFYAGAIEATEGL